MVKYTYCISEKDLEHIKDILASLAAQENLSSGNINLTLSLNQAQYNALVKTLCVPIAYTVLDGEKKLLFRGLAKRTLDATNHRN